MSLTMKTKTLPLMSLLVLILQATSYADEITQGPSITSSPSDRENSTDNTPVPLTTEPITDTPTTSKNTTTALPPATSPSVSTTSHAPQITPRIPPNSAATSRTPPTPPTQHKPWLVAILLVIVALMVLVGCVHATRKRRSNTNGSAPRLLLDVRDRLRSGVGNLEGCLGVRLWPEERSAEDEEEEQEEQDEQEGRNDRGEGSCDGGQLMNVNEKEEPKEDDSETSSEDYSSMEDGGLKEEAPNPQREAELNHSQNKQSTSGGENAAGGEMSRDTQGGSEEAAKKGHEDADLFNVTAL